MAAINTLRIATRSSALALWQARHVGAELKRIHRDIEIELIPITTTGDKILDRPLAKIGGKGLFIKELEHALFEARADIAVHSMKDVPIALPEGLCIAVILEREDPRDALVTDDPGGFDELAPGAVVGTSSVRRKSQLLSLRPDLVVRDLRGNVPTRIAKLRDGEFNAIVLASAGLKRLDLAHEIAAVFELDALIPAVGQGAIGIECRADDARTQSLIEPLNHPATALCVGAERAMSTRLDGGCDLPLAAHARLHGDEMSLVGLVAAEDGSACLRDQRRGAANGGEKLGLALAESLLAAGASDILAAIRRH